MICHKQQGTSLPNKHFGLDLNLWRKLSNGEDVTAKLRQYHRTQCDNPWRSCFNFISTLYFKVLVYALSMSAELFAYLGFFFLVVFFFCQSMNSTCSHAMIWKQKLCSFCQKCWCTNCKSSKSSWRQILLHVHTKEICKLHVYFIWFWVDKLIYKWTTSNFKKF